VPANVFGQLRRAAIVESRAVDQRAILRQAEEAWTGIAGLGLAGDRANFNKSETKRCQGLRGRSVLIKTRSQSYWVAELESKTFQLSKRPALKSTACIATRRCCPQTD
jgi:hypothetical protein